MMYQVLDTHKEKSRIWLAFSFISAVKFIGFLVCVSVFRNLYLSNSNLSWRVMTSRHNRVGFSDSSISPRRADSLGSCIFGYDIIHNSSINSTSHFLSVSRTILTLSPSIPSFSLPELLIVSPLHASSRVITPLHVSLSLFAIHLPRCPLLWVLCDLWRRSTRRLAHWLSIRGRWFVRRWFGIIWCLCLLISVWHQAWRRCLLTASITLSQVL